MEINIVRHPRCKAPRLTVTGPKEARLTLPRRFSMARAERFLAEHRTWLEEASGRMEAREEAARSGYRERPGQLLLLGEWHPFSTNPAQARLYRETEAGVILRDGRGLEKFYRDKAADFFSRHAGGVAEALGRPVASLRVKKMKTRWGSCSSKNGLNFNYLLMKAPEPVARYVAVHEACHLEELNHSRRFWALVERFHPEYKEAAAWLRTYGGELHHDPL